MKTFFRVKLLKYCSCDTSFVYSKELSHNNMMKSHHWTGLKIKFTAEKEFIVSHG